MSQQKRVRVAETHEVQIRKYTARACVAGQGWRVPGRCRSGVRATITHGTQSRLSGPDRIARRTYTARLPRPITPASSIGFNPARLHHTVASRLPGPITCPLFAVIETRRSDH